MKNRVNAINVGNTKRAKYFLYVFCINLPPYGYKCFLRKTEEEAADDRLLPLRILLSNTTTQLLLLSQMPTHLLYLIPQHPILYCHLHTQEEMRHNHL